MNERGARDEGIRARSTVYDVLRLWFGVVSHLAPGLAERQAAKLFLTPLKRPARPIVIAGVEPQPMQVMIAGRRLLGWSWGSGRPVLMIHGWSGRAADMTAIGTRLALDGKRAIAFDMPAHGDSPGRQTSLAEWTEILPSIGALFGPLDAVVGHSFGAAAAVLALDSGLGARRAVLIAPPTGPAYFIEQLRASIGLHRRRVRGVERRLAAIVGRPLADFDADRVAARLTVPALILHDPEDREVPFAHSEAIARAWLGSALVRMPGEGHHRILRSAGTLERVSAFVAARS